MRIALFLFGLCLASAGQAAIVVTSEGMGESSTQYFEKGRFVSMENGRPSVGIENDGNCWFVAENQRVQGRCEDMLNSMKNMRERMMSGLSEQDRAMVQQMQSRYMQMQKAPAIKEVAAQRIAGLDARCFEIGGSSHLICTNEGLLKKIEREMGSDFYRRLKDQFGGMAEDMGMEGMQESALAKLGEKGFIMKDVQAALPMGGMNTAMLQYLPPEQREAVMNQLAAAGAGGGEMQGLTVTSVDENGSIPPLDFSAFATVTFEEYIQQMMQQMSGFGRGGGGM